MDENDPIAFLSYVRADDEHDHGRISALRARPEGEVRMHTGKQFKIFQDKKDLKWGQHWKERLESTLLNVTFLIPVMTPSFFHSSSCREEFDKFLIREKQLGENRLILPVYYLDSDDINDAGSENSDAMAKVLASRNWADWRKLRFMDLTAPDVELAISEMALTIKGAMKELGSIIAASKAKPAAPSAIKQAIDLTSFSPTVGVLRGKPPAVQKVLRSSAYYAYTTEHDEEIEAVDLSDASEAETLNQPLRQRMRSIRTGNRQQINVRKSDPYHDKDEPIGSLPFYYNIN